LVSDQFGNGETSWEALEVLAPNTVTSTQANFVLHCLAVVTSIQITLAPPASYDCSSATPQSFEYTATIHVGATHTGYSIQGAFIGPAPLGGGGFFGSPHTREAIVVPPDTTTITTPIVPPLSITLNAGDNPPNGDYKMQFVTSLPNALNSNTATFTK